jgi:hypothetical protein
VRPGTFDLLGFFYALLGQIPQGLLGSAAEDRDGPPAACAPTRDGQVPALSASAGARAVDGTQAKAVELPDSVDGVGLGN